MSKLFGLLTVWIILALFIFVGVYLLGWIAYGVCYALPMALFGKFGVPIGSAIYLGITISTVLMIAVIERMNKENGGSND